MARGRSRARKWLRCSFYGFNLFELFSLCDVNLRWHLASYELQKKKNSEDGFYDNSPPPPQTSDFLSLTNVSSLLDTTKDAMKNIPGTSSRIFLFCKGVSNGDVGVATGAAFQKIWPGVFGFKTGDFVKEKLGRLLQNQLFFP